MSSPTAVPPPTPSRRRRILLWAVGLLVGLPVALFCYVTWSLSYRAQDAIAETDRLDPRWRLEDIEADRISPSRDENAAVVVMALIKSAGRRRVDDHPRYEKVFADLAPARQLNPEQLDLIRDRLDSLGESLQEARRLRDLPYGRYPLVYASDIYSTLIPDQADSRIVGDWLQHDAYARAQAGDIDGALESCAARLNVARSLGDEPVVITFLQRSAGDQWFIDALERVLAQGVATEFHLADMQARIRREIDDLQQQWINSIRGERAATFRLYEGLASGAMKVSQLRSLTRVGGGRFDFLLDRAPALAVSDYPEHLRLMNQYVEIAKLPVADQMVKLRALERGPGGPAFFSEFMPAFIKIAENHQRTQARLRCAMAALAYERYRVKNERWPAVLEQLVMTRFYDNVPIDPYTGQSLRMRRRPDGVVIYSLGPDGQDDGGDVETPPGALTGKDLGFRLWEPAKRRQLVRQVKDLDGCFLATPLLHLPDKPAGVEEKYC
jgi:hypothetical protein